MIMARNVKKDLFVARSYVLDIFFVHNTMKRDMPDRDVKALAVSSVFSLVTER